MLDMVAEGIRNAALYRVGPFVGHLGHDIAGYIHDDATRKGIDRSREAAQQLGERAGEYYETGRERAAELYSTASERVGDAARTARDTASDLARTARETAARQTGTVAAAIDAGKKAYQEEKRKTEMSGRIEAAPKYDEKAN